MVSVWDVTGKCEQCGLRFHNCVCALVEDAPYFPPEPQVPDVPEPECKICAPQPCIYGGQRDYGDENDAKYLHGATDEITATINAYARITTDAKERKGLPLVTGVLDYFPDALLAVAEVSRIGNEQHNPGQPLHWERSKSTDHADCIGRHLLERGTRDVDGGRHTAKAAWRILALLQLEIEGERG